MLQDPASRSLSTGFHACQSAACLAAMHGNLKAAALHAAAHLAPIVLVGHVQEVEPWAQAVAVLPEVLQTQNEGDTPPELWQ